MQVENQNTISSKPVYKTDHGQVIEYTLERGAPRFVMKVLNLGCIITEVQVLDREQQLRDVILGFQDKQQYTQNKPYFNGVVGRVCGRISDAKFELNGNEHRITANHGKDHLHGGSQGFSHRVWNSMIYNDGVEFELESEAMEEGFPGAVKIRVRITLLKDRPGYNTELWAKAEDDTLVALTSHEYWDLSGGEQANALVNHELTVKSDYFLEMGADIFPTGEVLRVEDFPAFDFREGKLLLGNRLRPDPHWSYMQGYDHSFVCSDPRILKEIGILAESNPTPEESQNSDSTDKNPKQIQIQPQNAKKRDRLVASLSCADSGITMHVYSSQNAVHLYSGDFLSKELGGSEIIGKKGKIYGKNSGLCLECQDFPNAVNIGRFKAPVLEKGEVYRHNITHVFSSEGK